MRILPPCRDHEKRINDLEENLKKMLDMIGGLIDAVKTTRDQTGQGLAAITETIKESWEGTGTPPDIEIGEPYHR